MSNLNYEEKGITVNELIPIEVKNEEFKILMNIYEIANNKVLHMLNGLKIEYNNIYNHDIIHHTSSRIKSPKSILKKMRDKDLKLNYKNLVENINDIAGVRVVCQIKDDIYNIANIISKIPSWNIIQEKDYVKKPKKSGYSGYHIIVEIPVKINDFDSYIKNQFFVKVEIQIRTMAMDFWATNEHKMKYKCDKKLSFFDSKKMAFYAKVINILDNQFSKINNKQKLKV